MIRLRMRGFGMPISWQRYKMNRFEKHILEYIRKTGMIQSGDTVLAALSGGPDSVCLIKVLCGLRRVLKISLYAAHVHHGLRGAEADRDEAFCRELSQKLDVPFESIHVDVRALVKEKGFSEEEAARILRYEALETVLENKRSSSPGEPGGRGCIAVAHHADDQAETILMNLLRGSGLKGLAGMQAIRGNIVRPLLETGRSEILRYLEEQQLSWCTDGTNLENDHTRNYLRNEILPRMREGINSKAAEHITAAGRMIAEVQSFMEETARTLPGMMEEGRGELLGCLILKRRILKEKPQILRRYVIIEGLKQIGLPLKDWGEAHFEEIDRALSGPSGNHADLPGGVTADNTRNETLIRPGSKKKTSHNMGEIK